MSWMPIMHTKIAVEFSVLNEEWARKNHGQSLARLAERGGLDAGEALAIIERRPWSSITPIDTVTITRLLRAAGVTP